MKTLLTNAAGTKRQPILTDSLDHIQEAYKESILALTNGYMADQTRYYILYGCIATQAGSDWSCTAGAIWYAGEVYLVDQVTGGSPITITGSNIIIGTITTTYATADPITMSDGTTDSVHEIKKIVWGQDASGAGVGIEAYEDMFYFRDQLHFHDVLPTYFRLRYESGGAQVWEATDTRTWSGSAYCKGTKQGKIITLDFNLIAQFNSGSPNNLSLDMSGLGFDLPEWLQPEESGIISRLHECENSQGGSYDSPEGAMMCRIYTGDGTSNAPDFQFQCTGLNFDGGTPSHTTKRTTLYHNFDYTSSSNGTRITSGSANFTLRLRGQFTYEADHYEQPIPTPL